MSNMSRRVFRPAVGHVSSLGRTMRTITMRDLSQIEIETVIDAEGNQNVKIEDLPLADGVSVKGTFRLPSGNVIVDGRVVSATDFNNGNLDRTPGDNIDAVGVAIDLAAIGLGALGGAGTNTVRGTVSMTGGGFAAAADVANDSKSDPKTDNNSSKDTNKDTNKGNSKDTSKDTGKSSGGGGGAGDKISDEFKESDVSSNK